MAAAADDDSRHLYAKSVRQTTTPSDTLRIVVLGSGGVGKSTIITQFLDDGFVETYMGTFESTYRREYVDKRTAYSIEIVDIHRGESVPSLRRLAVENGDAFILVYSIDDENSFEELYHFRDMILELKGDDKKIPIYIVANKLDLDEERKTPIWQIADAVATIDWEHGYMEISAMDKEQVMSLFNKLIRMAREVYKERFDSPRRMTLFSRIKRKFTKRKRTSVI